MKKNKKLPSLLEMFSEGLIYYRNRMDLTQAELAARAGVSTSTICQLEMGRKCPSFQTMEWLAGALNVKDVRLLFKVGRRA